MAFKVGHLKARFQTDPLPDPAKAKPLAEIGCEIALADLQDSEALAGAIANADATQIILPPSSQTKDTTREMQRAIESLAAALERTRAKRVLAISDYGAHVVSDIGMPSMFRMFEERLGRIEGRKLFLRSAEHMEGWARFIPIAISSGILPSFHDPVDKMLPMISAPDLGRIAAGLLMKPLTGKDLQIIHAEGPRRYCPVDVADALSQLLGRSIEAQAVPRSQRKASLERIMSESASELLFKVYDAHKKGGLIDVEVNAGEVCQGTTHLVDALRSLIRSCFLSSTTPGQVPQ